ncbi:molybdopterin-dependent oxidoreductase [Altererythrobacter salegens]|uniref:Molybdopterin-dependent oxidoreductase n=1 Tax=Croceibacterium salegens TaxID=1737568 RepID=A0A6I4SVZ0_9SPHN|nr:molybdopterin-dependent oxidoreductase [Croceibacterium salegens]MXO59220.1 molybdopterin-dependent oxidoreductase [Croceibacterium salegens]
MKRRNLIVGLGAGFLAGCSKVGKSDPMQSLFKLAEDWHRGAHRALAGKRGLAQEFTKADISPFFRGNGTTDPGDAAYTAHAATGFAGWTIAVTGLVDRPLELTLEQIKALPQRTQITRHDCVEGWSAIGEWTGPQLGTMLDLAGVQPNANYVVFRCADVLNGSAYYESVDMVDAYHPQTIVAHALNGAPLPVANGAPLRMRIERQLGYKSAKYVTAIEAVESLDGIHGGKGGYWEDRSDYQWYAGA